MPLALLAGALLRFPFLGLADRCSDPATNRSIAKCGPELRVHLPTFRQRDSVFPNDRNASIIRLAAAAAESEWVAFSNGGDE